MVSVSELRNKYLRNLPTRFCPGCGNGIVLGAFIRAVDELGLKPKDMLMCSGIGCSSWTISPYFRADTLHTLHGRPIAFATGAKVVNPNLKVVVFSGDGDLASIGGNHLIHGARRNMDMTVICINNFNYGMTGGQVSPTTPLNSKTTTTPLGTNEKPFDLPELVVAAGASYVARWTTYHARQLTKSIKKGMENRGFSFIEVLSQCPTYYGRLNKFKDAAETLNWFKENSTMEKGTEGKIFIGEFIDR